MFSSRPRPAVSWPGDLVTDMREMRKLLAELKPDIVHLHGGRDSWVMAGALTFRKEPAPRIIRTKHNIFPIADHAFNRWQYGKFFERLVVVSHAVRLQCEEKPYIAPQKIDVISSALDIERIDSASTARREMREELGFTPDDVVVAMTGRLRPEKGHDILIAAAPGLIAEHPRVKLLLIGSGSLKGDFQQQINEAGLAGRVVMTGFRDDVPRVLTAADLYVQPSRSDGLGTALMEACATRLPIVASRVGGIPEIIAHEETGLLCETESPESLRECMIRLLANPDIARQYATAAREHVLDVFSVETLVRKTVSLYERILTQPRRS
jgi:glycosyltransferase involved in cell wall biosynthesis